MSLPYTTTYASQDPDASWSIYSLLAPSRGAWVAAGIALVYLIFNLPSSSSPASFLWSVLVFATPTRVIMAVDRKKNPNMYDGTPPTGDAHTVKSEALRRIFGLESGFASALPRANSLRRASWLGAMTAPSDAPPGLGNWDNSCYQNSVLQGLSALRSLTTYLDFSDQAKLLDTSTTAGSLRDTMIKLNDPDNNGRRLWTPPKLKSMSSWQQQDAQEYFSKIMDDMEKETARAFEPAPTTQGLVEFNSLDTIKAFPLHKSLDSANNLKHNPLDGFLAQRVACTSCGFSEGLSIIPFNCLTVPLGRDPSYRVEHCLDEYTSLEEISGVECGKCTLLRTKAQLQHMTNDSAANDQSLPSSMQLPPELRSQVMKRLQVVEQALEENDLSDDTLIKKCQIPKKARVSSTKTRQAVIARAPKSLVIHVNRSVFDEYTGAQRKNLAHVTYPKILDLGPWCLGSTRNGDEQEEWRMDPSKSMIESSSGGSGATRMQYVLRAAVTHYGRHENGHYICYREHPEHTGVSQENDAQTKPKPAKWWRLSDDDVSAVTEDQVLSQGGVFMLFYELLDDVTLQSVSSEVSEPQHNDVLLDSAPTECVADVGAEVTETDGQEESSAPEVAPNPASAVTIDKETTPPELDIKRISTPQMMRAVGKSSKRGTGGLSSTYRAMAAT